ncbi:ComEC/Rec2 family competence protein, partial [Achromobacter xylosoxidans]|uniref:ComEC/Rec2 family competence protein n=1 Tax=Alcaligenes xylosoxydans xylosoxydans TaxID=85698 RepID=UPI0011788805
MAFVAGAGLVQLWPRLPGVGASWLLAGACLLASVGGLRWRRRVARTLAVLALGLCAGLLNAGLQAQYRLDEALSDPQQDAVSRLVLRVASLPEGDERGQRFLAELDEPPPPGIPSRIQISWQAPPGPQAQLPEIKPGQVWRMALVLRRPHGLLNPAGPDVEGRLFAQGIRAVATVRGQPRLLADRPWATPGIAIERARHNVREGLRAALGEHRYAPVMIALAIGDQAGVAREDWLLFNRSGITHLVSISGMHVTSIAGIA